MTEEYLHRRAFLQAFRAYAAAHPDVFFTVPCPIRDRHLLTIEEACGNAKETADALGPDVHVASEIIPGSANSGMLQTYVWGLHHHPQNLFSFSSSPTPRYWFCVVSLGAGSRDDLLCFRVVKADPSSWHTVATARGAGAKLQPTDVVVSTHTLFGTDDCLYASSSAAAETVFILQRLFLHLPLPMLQEGLMAWQGASATNTYFLPDMSLEQAPAVSQTIESLINRDVPASGPKA